MIAINMPMPEDCLECLFRGGCGLYDCMLNTKIRVSSFMRPPKCPLLEVKTMRVRRIEDDNDVVRIYMGRIIGEALAKKHIIRFITRPLPREYDLSPIQPRFNIVGEVSVVVPKNGGSSAAYAEQDEDAETIE